jgi:hypothetical protein
MEPEIGMVYMRIQRDGCDEENVHVSGSDTLCKVSEIMKSRHDLKGDFFFTRAGTMERLPYETVAGDVWDCLLVMIRVEKIYVFEQLSPDQSDRHEAIRAGLGMARACQSSGEAARVLLLLDDPDEMEKPMHLEGDLVIGNPKLEFQAMASPGFEYCVYEATAQNRTAIAVSIPRNAVFVYVGFDHGNRLEFGQGRSRGAWRHFAKLAERVVQAEDKLIVADGCYSGVLHEEVVKEVGEGEWQKATVLTSARANGVSCSGRGYSMMAARLWVALSRSDFETLGDVVLALGSAAYGYSCRMTGPAQRKQVSYFFTSGRAEFRHFSGARVDFDFRNGEKLFADESAGSTRAGDEGRLYMAGMKKVLPTENFKACMRVVEALRVFGVEGFEEYAEQAEDRAVPEGFHEAYRKIGEMPWEETYFWDGLAPFLMDKHGEEAEAILTLAFVSRRGSTEAE